MKPLERLRDHVRRVQRMASAVDIDLITAVDMGELDQQDWAEIVHHCRSCEWTEGCQI